MSISDIVSVNPSAESSLIQLSLSNTSAMYTYDTVSQAVKGLKDRGFTIDFNIEEECLVCHEIPLKLKANEFEITEFHRYEGDSDPGDEAVVYAIESKHGDKGILVNGFGVSADSTSSEMIEKLSVRR